MRIEPSRIISLLSDDNELNEYPKPARKEPQVLTKLTKSPNPNMHSAEHYPLRHVFQSMCQRIQKVISSYILHSRPILSQREYGGADIRDLDTFPWYGALVARFVRL